MLDVRCRMSGFEVSHVEFSSASESGIASEVGIEEQSKLRIENYTLSSLGGGTTK